MIKQKDLIDAAEWHNILILDACRFDYFEEEYSEFLDGELLKVWSPAPATQPWLVRTWTDVYDFTCVSGTPRINSVGKSWLDWAPTLHLKRILDVWNFGWDHELGTVPPWSMNEAAKTVTDGKGVYMHYMQPHLPYIGETKLTWDSSEYPNMRRAFSVQAQKSKLTFKKRRTRNGGDEFLRKVYRDNLRLVLEYVAEILPHLEGRTVVTSDHGEFLGEDGLLLHSRRFEGLRIAHEVPWLTVK